MSSCPPLEVQNHSPRWSFAITLRASVWQRAKGSPSKQWFQSTIIESYQRSSPRSQLVETNIAGRFLHGATSCDKQAFSGNEPVYVWNSLKHIWELGKVFNLPKPSREPRTCIVKIKGKPYQRTRGYLRPRVIQTPHTTSWEYAVYAPVTVISQETPRVVVSQPTAEMQVTPHSLETTASASSAVPAVGPETDKLPQHSLRYPPWNPIPFKSL